jgi:hypothetical protein
MYPPELQARINNANRRTQADRNKQFAKRSSDQQMLDHLAKSARVAVDLYFSNGRDCAEAMKELRSCVVLAERRAR